MVGTITSSAFLSTSPLRGTTARRPRSASSGSRFLSTSPLRGTTRPIANMPIPSIISIHVPLAGDDLSPLGTVNPGSRFLSTSPLRGTTSKPCWKTAHTSDFYPRPPCGGRRFYCQLFYPNHSISIHVPLAGDDGKGDGKYGVFPRTFVTTRHSVQKHAALLCSMRPFSRRICTKRPKNVGAPRCEPPGVFLRAEGSHRLFLCGGRFCTGAFTPAKYRPAPIAARGRHARPWFCTGCPAGKSAGCPHPGR